MEDDMKEMQAELDTRLKKKPFDEKNLKVLDNENSSYKREIEGLQRDIAKF